MSDASYDVVVVGMGGAGLCAALSYAETASEQGRTARIAVLERAPKEERGGATRYTTARIRIDDDNKLDPTFVDTVAATHRDADVDYLRTLERETPASIRFIEERGVELVHYPHGLATGIHGGREAAPTGGGKSIVEALATRLEQVEGAEIHYETEAVDLVTDARGAITGITARGRDGYLLTLSAPAVVLACGGWQNNKALMAQYLGPRAADMPLIAPGVAYNTGDGLRMATAVGAGVAGQFDMVHGEPYDTRTTYPDAVVLSYPYGILVNGKAERFLDEGVEPLDMTFEPFSYEIWRNQDNEAYLIGDQSMVEVPYFELLNTTDKEPETADTIAELAGKLGLDPAALEATVAEFNAACPDAPFDPTTKDGKATQGIEPPKTNWAHPVERGPFVGWPLTTAVCFVFGGVRTDAQARVVSPSGVPIPGLYGAGEMTGVFYELLPRGHVGAPRADVRPDRGRARRERRRARGRRRLDGLHHRRDAGAHRGARPEAHGPVPAGAGRAAPVRAGRDGGRSGPLGRGGRRGEPLRRGRRDAAVPHAQHDPAGAGHARPARPRPRRPGLGRHRSRGRPRRAPAGRRPAQADPQRRDRGGVLPARASSATS